MKYVRLYDCGRQVVLMMNVGLEMGGPTGPTGEVDGLDGTKISYTTVYP